MPPFFLLRRTPLSFPFGEGNTPLIHCERLVEAIGGEFDLYLKFEGLNPTASFKEQG